MNENSYPQTRLNQGSALLRSVFLLVLGLGFIPLGLNFLPGIGIFIGAALIGIALFPWLKFPHRREVNVLIGSVSDNNLQSRVLPVAILSASRERDGFDFDPRQVNPASAVFGPLRAHPVEDMTDSQVYRRNLVDLNGDGVPDLLLYFSGDTAGISDDDGKVCLRARAWDGQRVQGCNKVDRGYESGLNELVEYR